MMSNAKVILTYKCPLSPQKKCSELYGRGLLHSSCAHKVTSLVLPHSLFKLPSLT